MGSKKSKKSRRAQSSDDEQPVVADSLTEAGPAFGSNQYWTDTFADDGIYAQPYDWVASWADMKAQINELIPDKAARILLPGCGNAPFQPDMCAEGYTNMVCGDNCELVIEQMRHGHGCKSMQWDVMDATDMVYEDDSFDVVLDKSLMDCLHCCKGSSAITQAYTNQVFRVLKPGGLFIRISLHQEKLVRANLRGWNWTIDAQLVEAQAQADAVDVSENDGQFGSVAHGTALLCVCTKGEEAQHDDEDSFAALPMGGSNKKDKKKAAKQARRLMRLNMEEAALEEQAEGEANMDEATIKKTKVALIKKLRTGAALTAEESTFCTQHAL